MYANISSMNAHTQYLNTNANNIANVNSDGFIPTETNLAENINSVGVNLKQADNKNLPFSQTNLTKEIPEQILIGYGFNANAISFKTYDEMMGSIIDLKA